MTKLKLLTAAVGLAILAGQASAAIRLPSDASTNGSELFAVVYDTETKASFLLDLGQELQNFLPTPAGAGVTSPGTVIPYNLSSIGNFGSFLALTDGSPALRFLVAGADSTGGTAAGGVRYMGTGVANPFAGRTNTQVSSNFGAAPSAYLSYNQNRGTHNSGTPVSENGSSISVDSEAQNFGKAGVMTPTWNGVSGNLTGALGESLNFYYVQRNPGNNANGALALTDQYDNAFGAAKWTFSQTGAGDYMLVYTAPVPEPETWALLLAGMALVGGVARRRAAAK